MTDDPIVGALQIVMKYNVNGCVFMSAGLLTIQVPDNVEFEEGHDQKLQDMGWTRAPGQIQMKVRDAFQRKAYE